MRADKERRGLFWCRFDDGTERPATVNLVPGTRVYGEQIVGKEKQEFRVWDPYRSKLSAALLHELSAFGFSQGISVLYLGASTGTTVSHISDIVGLEGVIYSVEFAPRVMRNLIQVCTNRPNLIPILADARYPEEYLQVPQLVDVIYQDVAQPNQAEILIANAKRFLKEGGTAYVAVKARSIDVVEKPKRVFQQEEKRLTKAGFTIVDRLSLEPYTADHIFFSAIYSGVAR
ncbi:MAG: fibrillarin-like rRNA/tRNA 2'-O-methyltransferase [Promethearchaeota archaeon]